MTKPIQFTTLLVLSTLSLTGNAKTFYVESFGNDDSGLNLTCSKTLPCASITHVIDNVAGDRDRILVGPGTYAGRFTINQAGLKLTSVAGADATHIVADGGIAITINGDKVVVGQKKKGFTISGVYDGDDGVFIDADKVKFEGNRMFGPESTPVADSDYAISIGEGNPAHQATIRYNTITSFDGGIYAETFSPTAPKHNFSDNHFQDLVDICIALESGGAPNSRNKIKNNILDGCEDEGIFVDYDDDRNSGDRIEKNVVMNVTGGSGSTGISVSGGNPQILKNLVKSAATGIDVRRVQSARIKDNLIQDIAETALDFTSGSPGMEVTGNTLESIGSVSAPGAIAIEIGNGDEANQFKKFSRNNLINLVADGCPITFRLAPTGEWKFSKNFWGDLSDPEPDLSCDTRANDALGTVLTLDPVAKANPVKYKSPF